MPRKKNYDKGIVRRIAGNIFFVDGSTSSNKNSGDGRWRPRKSEFNRLDGEDIDDDSFPNICLTESESGDYKREIFYEHKKKIVNHQSKKRSLSSVNLKPSARDKKTKNSNSAKKKKQRTTLLESPIDGCTNVPFNFNHVTDDSIDNGSSKNTGSPRHNGSFGLPSPFSTVQSDPSSLFALRPPEPKTHRLTQSNLATMAAMAADSALARSFSDDGIENRNPRSKFYQFTIDEDRESTVILPVGSDDEEDPQPSEDGDNANDNDFGSVDNNHMNPEPKRESPLRSLIKAKENDTLPIKYTGRHFNFDFTRNAPDLNKIA